MVQTVASLAFGEQMIVAGGRALGSVELTDLTVGVYLERWLAHARSRVRVSTYEGYRSLVRCHAGPRLGNRLLVELHPLDLQQLYGDLLDPEPPARPLSAGTVLNLHLLLTQAFGQATRWQLLSVNPAAGAQPPRPRRPANQVGDPALLQLILDRLAGHPLELPVAIAIATGMRRGEILGLRWQDVTADYATAHIQQTLQPTANGLVVQPPKTHRSRRAIALPTFLQSRLRVHRSGQQRRQREAGSGWTALDLVVERGDGRPLNPDTLSSGWRRFLCQHKLPQLRFHDLRHSHATLMLLQGVHPKIVSERLGHASIGITLDTYTHVLPSLQQEAVSAFDDLFG
jgi:integrase